MEGPLETIRRYWIYAVLGIFAANSLVLDLFLFFPKDSSSQTILPGNINLPNISQNFCPQACIDQMNLNLVSPKATDASVIQPKTTLTPTSTPIPTSSPTPAKTVREFFIPLGSGTGKTADWTVVDGMGAKIDPSDYGDIKQVTFEVSAWIPTGNQTIWIRLYNATASQVVAGSEVTLSGGTATLLTSSPITLTSGNNLYQVQMKTQLQANTNIDMARLRIKTN